METVRNEEEARITVTTTYAEGWEVQSVIYRDPTFADIDRKVFVYLNRNLVLEILLRKDGQFWFCAKKRPEKSDSSYVSYWGESNGVPGEVMQEAFLRLYEWNGE